MESDLRRWMILCEDVNQSLVDNLLAQVPQARFVPVDGKRWRTIRDEGLDDEQNAPERTQWQMAALPISKELSAKLVAFDDDTVELFNLFDIHLKERYNGKIVDLIDYDKGLVVLVKVG